ncbi:LacI family DNA-binding transcriptional regulator [Spongiactinospora sp. TRM90649]|uniref:LacI family DNA-binding transcriptional regulator n=1 Tax=Spongiactinospora sp. TRM90649 TaxID=3031114 RepID=UPI0023F9DFA0|nr:LacI family DNA-binding transcriptional regulator [Spongiactinospora sp. TRM90649]MDF5752656.1 LacI family DNA-binding transcriptional regulator [Spongiactinospora sp. TRM90649]
MPRDATLEDVARQAGVSLATASRVLNGSTRQVGRILRERVEEAATELGYTTNRAAQALARSASDILGLVVHDLSDPYFAELANAVVRAADAQHLAVMVGTTFRDPEAEIGYVATLRAQRVRAIVLAGSRVTDHALTERLRAELIRFHGSGGRAVVIGQDLLGVDTVLPDNRGGSRALAVALAGLGHIRFAVLTGPSALLTAADRVAGFAEGLASLGLPEPVLVSGEFDRDGGYVSAGRLWAAGTGVTCLFAVNDVMAVGALAALRDAGADVPGEISVAGFDDIPTLRDLTPALTTVRLPLAAMGRRAVELALGSAPVVAERATAEVIIRESTRRLP